MMFYFIAGALTASLLLWMWRLQMILSGRKEATRAALESTDDGVLILDSRGKVLAYNRKFAEMWSIPGEVLKSKDDSILFRHVLPQLRDPDAELAKHRRLYANSTCTDDYVHFKDGRIFERHLEPQHRGKRLIGWAWGFRDITERIKLEEAAEAERRLLHVLMNNLLDYVYFKDAQGRFTRVNQAHARILGFRTPKQWWARAISIFSPPSTPRRPFTTKGSY